VQSAECRGHLDSVVSIKATCSQLGTYHCTSQQQAWGRANCSPTTLRFAVYLKQRQPRAWPAPPPPRLLPTPPPPPPPLLGTLHRPCPLLHFHACRSLSLSLSLSPRHTTKGVRPPFHSYSSPRCRQPSIGSGAKHANHITTNPPALLSPLSCTAPSSPQKLIVPTRM
jgi:hypothetical protein